MQEKQQHAGPRKDNKHNKLQAGANSTTDQQTYSVFWMEAGMDDSIHILHSVITVAAMKCKVGELG